MARLGNWLRFRVRMIRLVTILGALAALSAGPISAFAAAEEGVALAIVYDTSGSMRDTVPDGAGRPAAKYVIANRALESIARRVETFATNAPGPAPRKIYAGLFIFNGNGARAAIPFGPFDAAVLRGWGRKFSNPNGGTPLGTAVNAAAQAVLNSNLTRKHVLVITDGESNLGPDPASVMPELKRQADQRQTGLSFHFIAFDVDAKVFAGVKKLGATVVAASNESQLNTQLEYILAKKILLEDEEPPKQK
jgi:hypothetical protein